MIYNDIFNNKTKIIRPLVKQFFKTALKNQSHPCDFYIISINGYYAENNPNSPYVHGADWENIASNSFEDYLKWYISNNYFKKDNKEKINCDSPEFKEYLISIHNEKAIYLRYWESDTVLKELYQLVRLCCGLPYDWKWKQELAKYNCRQEFIRTHIKVPLEKIYPELYLFFFNTIKRQIRNAIAHSQYCLLNNEIKYLNYKKTDSFSQLILLKYSEWEEIIHNTIVFRNECVNYFNQIYLRYKRNAKMNNNIIEIRLAEKEFVKFNIV